MGPTLCVERTGPGEKPGYAAKRGPSIRIETDTATHPGMHLESVGKSLTRPLCESEGHYETGYL
jgi:hypothetical protein